MLMRIGFLITAIILLFLGGGLVLWSSNYTIICNGDMGQVASLFSSDVASKCGIFRLFQLAGFGTLGLSVIFLIFGFALPDENSYKHKEKEHFSNYSPKYCEECGHQLKGHERHCPECGHRL